MKVVGIEVDTADSAGASGGGELGRDGARQSPYCYFYLQQHRASNTLFYKHNDGYGGISDPQYAHRGK